jgi:hypothetical protein
MTLIYLFRNNKVKKKEFIKFFTKYYYLAMFIQSY